MNNKEKLRDMLDHAVKATESIFKTLGEVRPTLYFADRDDSRTVARVAVDDKNEASAAMRAILQQGNAVRYVYIDEAWSAEAGSKADAAELMAWVRAGKSLESHPKRIEVLTFAAEDWEGNNLMATRRIVRPESGPAELQPVEVQEMSLSAGRFSGLLAKNSRH